MKEGKVKNFVNFILGYKKPVYIRTDKEIARLEKLGYFDEPKPRLKAAESFLIPKPYSDICELEYKTFWIHSKDLATYTLGENTQRIRLCSICANNFGFYSDSIPEWYPEYIDKNTNIKKCFIKYVESNFLKGPEGKIGYYKSTKSTWN